MADSDVTVKVDSARVGAFYEWFGRWLCADDEVVAVPKGQVIPLATKPWDLGADAQLASTVAWTLGPAAREVLAILVDQAGTPVAAAFIAARSGGATPADVAQLVAEVALLADKQDRSCPIRWTDAGGNASYWLRAEHASMWRNALATPPAPPALPAPVSGQT